MYLCSTIMYCALFSEIETLALEKIYVCISLKPSLIKFFTPSIKFPWFESKCCKFRKFNRWSSFIVKLYHKFGYFNPDKQTERGFLYGSSPRLWPQSIDVDWESLSYLSLIRKAKNSSSPAIDGCQPVKMTVRSVASLHQCIKPSSREGNLAGWRVRQAKHLLLRGTRLIWSKKVRIQLISLFLIFRIRWYCYLCFFNPRVFNFTLQHLP